MAFTKPTYAVNNIQTLDDLTLEQATAVKILHDKTGADNKAYQSDVFVPELDAADAANVKKTGDQTIAGIKTFSSSPIIPAPTTDLQASTKKYVDDKDTAQTGGLTIHKSSADHDGRYYTETEVDNFTVKLTGNQTVAGVKTFSSPPIVPTPTTDMQPSTKKYVDDHKASSDHDGRYFTEAELSSTADGSSGADKVAVTAIPTLAGSTVQAVLESAKARFDDINTVNVNAEVASTHLGADGGTYATLPIRLDSIDTQLADNATLSAQTDFVNLIRDRAKYKRLRVRKNTLNATVFDVVLDDGVKHITYDFQKNVNDDFWLFREGYTADLASIMVDHDDAEDASERTGVWVTSGGANYYTTEVGATFTCTAKGSEIKMSFYADNRGGIWSIVVDGGAPVVISTWASPTISINNISIITGLDPAVEHTVVGTFAGDDPAHAPTGGPSRGWLYVLTTATDRHSVMGYAVEVATSYSYGKMLLGQSTNKEFAFNITKDAISNYFPEHNGVGTAFAVSAPQFLLDNVALDFDAMVAGEFVVGDSFQLIQSVYCQFAGIVGNIAKCDIIITIGLDGVVSLSGHFEVLQDCTISGYSLMFPLVDAVIREFVSGIGTDRVSTADESMYYYTSEEDKVFSFAGIDSRNPDCVSAMTIDNPIATLRYGKTGRAVDMTHFWFLHQRAIYPKLYPYVFQSHSAVTGEKYNFHGRFIIADIPNIYNYIKPV